MKLDEVLPYLICNRCECVELTLRKATGTDKPSGSSLIECNACHNKYLIDDGIIVTEPALWRGHDSPRARIFRTTFSSYSNWWLKVNKGIGYKQDLALLFKQQTGRDRAFLGGKSVLDAGCGAGRFISHVSEAPDSKVIAFDLGLGLKVAKERNANRQNIAYVQGNILNPPFREGVFDFVYSFGVLHHTPDPRIAFSRLASLVKVGGEFALYLYYRPHLAFKDWGVSYALKQAYLFLYREPIMRFFQILPHPLVLLFSRVIYYRGPVMEFFYRRNGKIIGDFIRA